MKSRLFVSALLTMFSVEALCSGSGARGGGNEIGLEFTAAAQQALLDLNESRLPGTSPADIAKLQTALANAQVTSTDEDLFVEVGGHKQKVIAVNFPETLEIQINASYWDAVSDASLRESIVLHELESLLSAEGTGKYQISSALFNYLIKRDPGEKRSFDCQYDSGDHFVHVQVYATSREQAQEIVLVRQPVQFDAAHPVFCRVQVERFALVHRTVSVSIFSTDQLTTN